MGALFCETNNLGLPDSDIGYYPNFLEHGLATQYLNTLKEKISWRQDSIKLFGKTYLQPRLTALFANNAQPYTYSNITMHPQPFNTTLLEIKTKIEQETKEKFTSCLLNLYRNGKDSNGWHADDEPELGINPVIASLSLGQERFFHLRHKKDKKLKLKILLGHGSLLLMKGETQHHWQHQVPKTKKPIDERINLTFRTIR
ncbi:MAG: alpha-ketoglutarate-dependent dioxygenase AlkB [Bacteroidota bacterium]